MFRKLNIKHDTRKSLNTHLTEFMKMKQVRLHHFYLEVFILKLKASPMLYIFLGLKVDITSYILKIRLWPL